MPKEIYLNKIINTELPFYLQPERVNKIFNACNAALAGRISIEVWEKIADSGGRRKESRDCLLARRIRDAKVLARMESEMPDWF